MALAKAKVPQATNATIQLAVGYAGSTMHPYRNPVDVIRDAQRIATEAGRAQPAGK